MLRTLIVVLAVIIALHGAIHVMGFVAYWPLSTVSELPYKTSLLNGQWELGGSGMRVFSVIWLLAAGAFVLAALGLVMGSGWWQPLMLAAALVSLLLTAVDWQVAYRGGIIDVVLILALLVLPRVSMWIPRALSS